jgi:2,4-dienoyl-CoA reductase-like NADH-dependent reductase (Old Yellow Enzyme family)
VANGSAPKETDKRLLRLPPVERWPTAEEVARSRWFSPIRIGPVEARERTWIPAMVPWRATEDGFVTENVLSWYRRFAEGAPGVIVVEATGIRDVPSGPLLRIGHDRYVPGLRRLVETVREASGGRTRLFLQILDFLVIKRRPTREKFIDRYLTIDTPLRERLAALRGDPAIRDLDELAIRVCLHTLSDEELRSVLSPRARESLEMGYRERVTDLHLPHIRDLPRTLPPLFAAAARRAREAGFDGVELHYAHAYTMASFLSKLNDRDDGYGGPREHRVRLPLEVYHAVRAEVGRDWVVGVRFLGDDVVEGGSRIDDAMWFAVRFAEAGFDYLSVSKGGRFEDAKQPKIGEAAYPYTGPSGHECMPTVHIGPPGPFGRNVPLAAAVRRAVREAGYETPVVTAGGISTFEQAEAILARGDADVVATARQALADPDFFEKLRRGRGDAIRRCLFTNYCEALDQAHKEVTCQRWDREYLPDEDPARIPKSADGKRRLIAPPWIPRGSSDTASPSSIAFRSAG